MTSRTATSVVGLVIVAMFSFASAVGAADLYWDGNGTSAGFGGAAPGTWGTSSFWTTDSTGGSSNSTATTTSGDRLIINVEDQRSGGVVIGVTGNQHASGIFNPNGNSGASVTINNGGSGVIHFYGTGIANPILQSGGGDAPIFINAPVVLEQAAGSDVYFGGTYAGGNNHRFNLEGGLSSVNSVNLIYQRNGHALFSGDISGFKGTFTSLDSNGKVRGPNIQSPFGSGVTDVTQNGSGALTLSAANLHTGTTKSLAGTLRLANVDAVQSSTLDISGTGAIAFAVSGTNTYNLGGLQGDGSIDAGGNTLNAAGVSPGNSVGLLTVVNGTLNISGIVDTGTLLFELGDDTGPGTTYDQVSLVNEILNIGTLNFDDFTFVPEVGFGAGTYTLFDADSIIGNIGMATGSIGDFDALLEVVGNDVVLTATAAAVPEPASVAIWSLLGLALCGWVVYRRRQC